MRSLPDGKADAERDHEHDEGGRELEAELEHVADMANP